MKELDTIKRKLIWKVFLLKINFSSYRASFLCVELLKEKSIMENFTIMTFGEFPTFFSQETPVARVQQKFQVKGKTIILKRENISQWDDNGKICHKLMNKSLEVDFLITESICNVAQIQG